MKLLDIAKRFSKWNRKGARALERRFPRLFESPDYRTQLIREIHDRKENCNPRNILEIGGADRPLLAKGQDFVYDGVDIQKKDDCCGIYDNFIVQTIEEPLTDEYGMIISITLLEHVSDNRAGVRNVFEALRPSGTTHHYTPSKCHPYSVVLRILGPVWQKRLIPILRPGTEDVSGYPAYFNRCSVNQMRRLFEDTGFADIKIRSYYRANDYFAFFLPFFIVVTAFENACRWLKWDYFASGFIISARRPERTPVPVTTVEPAGSDWDHEFHHDAA